jgi:hypothetical protein
VDIHASRLFSFDHSGETCADWASLDLQPASTRAFNLAEKAWWLEQIARGLVSAESAKGYIANAERVIQTKLDVPAYC